MSELPPEVQPQPLPVVVQVAVTGNADTRFVVLQIADATGVRVVFLNPDAAESVGGQIRAAGKQAKTGAGLIVPGGGLIVPGGQ